MEIQEHKCGTCAHQWAHDNRWPCSYCRGKTKKAVDIMWSPVDAKYVTNLENEVHRLQEIDKQAMKDKPWTLADMQIGEEFQLTAIDDYWVGWKKLDTTRIESVHLPKEIRIIAPDAPVYPTKEVSDG